MEPKGNFGYFEDPNMAIILFAILVKRLGGVVDIKQSDIDNLSFGQLIEDRERQDDGIIVFTFVERGALEKFS